MQTATIEKLEAKLAEHDGVAKEHEADRAALESVAHEATDKAGVLEKQLKAKETEIGTLNSRLDDRHGELDRLQHLLGARQPHIRVHRRPFFLKIALAPRQHLIVRCVCYRIPAPIDAGGPTQNTSRIQDLH